jgi:transmembrane sensor
MEDGPLGAAVEQLERSFDGTIILADGSLAERPVTGVFDLHDPEASLRAMAKALGLRVRKVTPWVLIVSAS